MSEKNLAIAEMLLCATLWSIAGLLIKMIDASPFVIAGWRSAVAAAVTFVFVKLYGVPLHFTKRAVLNGCFMSLTFFLFVTANKLTTAANAIVLQFTAPIFLMVYSTLIFHQRFRKGDILAAIFTLAGIALFFFDQLAPGYMLGNFIAIFAGASMGAMYLFVGSGKPADRFSGTLLGHLFTAVIGIPFMLFTETHITGTAVASVVVLGVVQLGLPYILFVLSTSDCPPLACSLLGAMEPLLNPIWVALCGGEVPGVFALIGAVIVIVTVTVWCIWKDRHPAEELTAAE